jgi:hypothetical protein
MGIQTVPVRKGSFNASPGKAKVGRICGPPSLKNMSSAIGAPMAKARTSMVPSLHNM